MGERTLERSSSDLTIACFLWGLWGMPKATEYVNNLFWGVKRNLSLPHRFICFSDRTGIGFHPKIEVMPLSANEVDFRWNLTKMVAYKPGNGLTGRVLLFDLDVVIVGSLDELAQNDSPFITCEAAYHKNSIGGSLIGFDAGTWAEELWNPMTSDQRRPFHEVMTEGSERRYFANQLKGNGHKVDYWQDLYPGQVLSYKVNCRGRSYAPDNSRVIRFHGHPRPHEIRENWIKRKWNNR